MQERLRCAVGVGGSTAIVAAGDGCCTLGDRRNIGDADITGCRSVRGSFCFDRTSRIERTGVLWWGDVVADGGVARGATTLGGGGTNTEGDATGGGTTLGCSIVAVTGAGL